MFEEQMNKKYLGTGFRKLKVVNKSRYFFLILINIFICVQVKGQSNTSSIEQHCVNFFANYILGKESKLQDRKVYFDWKSLPKQTVFSSRTIKHYFLENPELEKEAYYSQYAESLEPIKIENVESSYFVKRKKKKAYTLSVYQKRQVGEYYYVLFDLYLSSELRGYKIYFQVKNTREPLQYVFVDYIY